MCTKKSGGCPPDTIVPGNYFFVGTVRERRPVSRSGLGPVSGLRRFGSVASRRLSTCGGGIGRTSTANETIMTDFNNATLKSITFMPNVKLGRPGNVHDIIR